MKASDETVHIAFDIETEIPGIDLERLKQLIRHICRRFEVSEASIEIQIVGDEGIMKIHEQFLGSSATTDVISFDLSDDHGQCFQLVVNVDMARRKSEELDHSAEAELALYITHGMLHNLGFDDAEPVQAKKMHETEDALLQELGFGIIYYKQENSD
jgi:probable rRNA maturation factor